MHVSGNGLCVFHAGLGGGCAPFLLGAELGRASVLISQFSGLGLGDWALRILEVWFPLFCLGELDRDRAASPFPALGDLDLDLSLDADLLDLDPCCSLDFLLVACAGVDAASYAPTQRSCQSSFVTQVLFGSEGLFSGGRRAPWAGGKFASFVRIGPQVLAISGGGGPVAVASVCSAFCSLGSLSVGCSGVGDTMSAPTRRSCQSFSVPQAFSVFGGLFSGGRRVPWARGKFASFVRIESRGLAISGGGIPVAVASGCSAFCGPVDCRHVPLILMFIGLFSGGRQLSDLHFSILAFGAPIL